MKEERNEKMPRIKEEKAENIEDCDANVEKELFIMKCEVNHEPHIPQKKKGKTNAQRQKEYRQRKKEEKERLNPKKKPKTDAERQRQFRLKQKMLLQSEQLDSNVARHSPETKQRKSSKEYKKAYREKLKKIKQNLSIEEKPKKTHSQRQREYRQRIKNKIDGILKIKALREKEVKSCQLDVISQKEGNYSQKREKEEVIIKQENIEDYSSAEAKTDYPIIEDIKEEKIIIKCEVFEEPLHPSGSGNDVTSATAQIQVKLEPQDELPVENSLYFEVPPLFRLGSADKHKFATFATERIQVKVEYEEDDETWMSEPSQMEFP